MPVRTGMGAEAVRQLAGHGAGAEPRLEAVQEGRLLVLGQHVEERHAARRQQLRRPCAGFRVVGSGLLALECTARSPKVPGQARAPETLHGLVEVNAVRYPDHVNLTCILFNSLTGLLSDSNKIRVISTQHSAIRALRTETCDCAPLPLKVLPVPASVAASQPPGVRR